MEIIGHKQAIDYIETLAANDEPVGEWQIRQLHQLIMYGDRQDTGRYRTVNVMAAGSGHKYPDQMQVPELMAQFSQWLFTSEGHPVIKAAEAHYRFVSIHPFSDGNGRAGRLLQNLLLLRNGYPPITLLVSDRARYIDSLFQAQTNNDDLSDFLELGLRTANGCIERNVRGGRYIRRADERKARGLRKGFGCTEKIN